MNVKISKTESITNRTMLAVDKLNRLSERWLTRDEKQLVDKAVLQSGKNADAAILYMLYTDYGFTAEQLTQLITDFRKKYAYIEGDFTATVEEIPELEALKAIGVDLDKLYEG